MHGDHAFGGGQEQRAAADTGDIVVGARGVVDRIPPPRETRRQPVLDKTPVAEQLGAPRIKQWNNGR
jgi:hypothetical protein